MPASPALPGLFFTFAATVLLIFVCVSVPVWDRISFLNVGTGANQLRYGVFGYTGTKVGIGYDFVGQSGSRINNATIHNLTRVLILHPIACGLAGIAFLFGLCGAGRSRAGTVWMTLFSALAALVTLVIFIIDLALFGIVRNRYRNEGIPAQYGNANWLTAGALAALLIAFFTSCCGVFGRYSRRRKEVV